MAKNLKVLIGQKIKFENETADKAKIKLIMLTFET